MAFREYSNDEEKMFIDDEERYDYLKECFYYGFKLPDIRTIEKYFKDSEFTAEYGFTFVAEEYAALFVLANLLGVFCIE